MNLNKTAKRLYIAVIALVACLFSAPIAWAAEETAKSGGRYSLVLAVIFLAAGLGMGLGVLGPALGQGNAVKAACEGMARNPSVAGKIMTTMLLGLAIMESLAIYALVVVLMLLFVFAKDLM